MYSILIYLVIACIGFAIGFFCCAIFTINKKGG